jgi:hypothetical protein
MLIWYILKGIIKVITWPFRDHHTASSGNTSSDIYYSNYSSSSESVCPVSPDGRHDWTYVNTPGVDPYRKCDFCDTVEKIL